MSHTLPVTHWTKAQLETVPCALCGGARTRPFSRKYGLDIVKCRECGLVYCNPRVPIEEADRRYNTEYFQNEYLPAVIPPNGPEDGAFLDDRYKAPLALLAHGRPPGRLVEIGTGAGFFLKAAVRAGFDAYGLDLSADAAEYARKTLGLRVIEAPAEEMPFEPGYFSAAAMFEVIEHLRDPMSVLLAARRALATGGRLVVSTPNIDALSRYALGWQWAMLNPCEHLYYFSETTLRGMLLKAGFRSVHFERTYTPWLYRETMNAYNTHVPDSWRSRAYLFLVERYAPHFDRYRRVQRWGLADGLLAVAEA